MEGTWQKRLEDVRKRESEFNAKLSKKEADAEQQLYGHRQRMLADMETVRRRDAESRKHAEEAQLHITRQETRCRELERDLEVKLAQMEHERADLSRERESELSRIRVDMLRLREEEQRELTSQVRCMYKRVERSTFLLEQSVSAHTYHARSYIALCCMSVVQCGAVCCSVWWCIGVWCSVLQCVAVCSSVLQCVTVCCLVL